MVKKQNGETNHFNSVEKIHPFSKLYFLGFFFVGIRYVVPFLIFFLSRLLMRFQPSWNSKAIQLSCGCFGIYVRCNFVVKFPGLWGEIAMRTTELRWMCRLGTFKTVSCLFLDYLWFLFYDYFKYFSNAIESNIAHCFFLKKI